MRAETKKTQGKEKKPIVMASMFGNTTKCVNQCRARFEQLGYQLIVWHSVGKSGGGAMEANLQLENSYVAGVLDITTTEWADELCGGVFSAGPTRLDAPALHGIPHLIVPGCIDMVNFGSFETLPEKYKNDSTRKFYKWNPTTTLMRTNIEENEELARIFANKAKKALSPVAFLIPTKGFSILDSEGHQFYDPECDDAFIQTLKNELKGSEIEIVEIEANINDELFSEHATNLLLSLIQLKEEEEEKGKEKEKEEKKEQKQTPEKKEWAVPLPDLLDSPRLVALHRLRKLVENGIPIIGAGAGTGISAKFEEQGGADLIIIYNSGKFRMAGRGSLAGLMPYQDANGTMLQMANEVLPVVKDTFVLAGVCATDPFRDIPLLLRKIKKKGFTGVQNFPTVGLIDGNFRKNLEETGMSYSVEVEMIAEARKLGLLTTPYAFNTNDAIKMTEAGADVIVAHMGLTTSGTIGAQTALTLDDSVSVVQDIADAARSVNPDVIVLCHGGPISLPHHAEYVLQNTTNVHGFYGASSMERLPVEKAITQQIQSFKNISMN